MSFTILVKVNNGEVTIEFVTQENVTIAAAQQALGAALNAINNMVVVVAPKQEVKA